MKAFSFIILLLIVNEFAFASETQRGIGVEANTQQLLGKRVALVVGNQNYKNTPLRNPENDARDLSAILSGFGFEVITVLNTDPTELAQSLTDFHSIAAGADAAVFFFAGHGVQYGGVNYMLPVSPVIQNNQHIEEFSVTTEDVMGVMKSAGVRTSIVIIDACRDNPFATRSLSSSSTSVAVSRGLARFDASNESIIVFATAPGHVASDGIGDNSLYTSQLLKYIVKPGWSLNEILMATRNGVMQHSTPSQIPWESSSLTKPFYFLPVSDETPTQSESTITSTLPLFIHTKPSDANVSILNISGSYSNGMSLYPGNYQINVSRSGFEPITQWISLGEQTHFNVTLQPKVQDETVNVNGVAVNLVAIEGGEMLLGCDYLKHKNCESKSFPQVDITVTSFQIMQSEVTNRLYQLCLDDGYCVLDSDLPNESASLPVSRVNYEQITNEFIPWISEKTGKVFGLPTEYEWEYAAKGQNARTLNWQSRIGCQFANFQGACDDNNAGLLPVMSKEPNSLSLFDMHGNVAEWTSSCDTYDYVDYAQRQATAEFESCEQHMRVVKGGSWSSRPREVEAYFRSSFSEYVQTDELGFRLIVRPLSPR